MRGVNKGAGISVDCHYRDMARCQLDIMGGRLEPEDRDLTDTLLRELSEESGVPLNRQEIMREAVVGGARPCRPRGP